MPTEIELQAFRAIVEMASHSIVPLICESGADAGVYGTGTLFTDEKDYYLITACHVADAIRENKVGVPSTPRNSEIWTLGNGELTYSQKADVAVFRIGSADSQKKLLAGWTFLTPDFVWTGAIPDDCSFLLYGFPSELGKMKGGTLHSPPASFVTTRFQGTPTGFGDPYDPNIDVILTHKAVGLSDQSGTVVDVPNLPGVSGCPVWAVAPVESNPNNIWVAKNNARISAIETSYVKGSWIRARRWSIVQKILDEFNEHQ